MTEESGREPPCATPPGDNCWVRAATSSAAVLQRSSRPPTCALVPRRGSSVGTRWSESRPGTSKITESQDAAATESAYCRRQRPRKYALVSSGGLSIAQSIACSSVIRIIRPRMASRL